MLLPFCFLEKYSGKSGYAIEKSGSYKTLKTVFEQQYRVSEDKIVLPLENEKVSARSIQSPHDTDCHYRNKDGNKVKGYSVNITETCDQSPEEEAPLLNLITPIRR